VWASRCLLPGGLASGEGLIWAVRDPIEKKVKPKEGKRQDQEITKIVDEGVEDKRLLVLETEFASPLRVIRRETNTLSAVIRRAWDKGDLNNQTKQSPARATGAHISLPSAALNSRSSSSRVMWPIVPSSRSRLLNVCLRSLVLVLRYSGMRIGDSVRLTTDQMTGNKLMVYTQKTGVPVNSVLPDFVIRRLEATSSVMGKHLFWEGTGNLEAIVGSWQKRLRKLFKLAGVSGGHAHRFRDTFAVELLLAGVPLERVSILLGHQSVRVTERYYSAWTDSRQRQVEADLKRAWEHDPIVLLETKATRRLRGESEAVN
jgi:integrase